MSAPIQLRSILGNPAMKSYHQANGIAVTHVLI